MSYCNSCGAHLSDETKFCPKCGTKTTNSSKFETQRETIYDGTIHHCTSCGAVLKSFEAICPACKNEIRGASTSKAVNEFVAKLDNCKNEKQKIELIRNFPIPNTREDVLEFTTMASANFDSRYYATHLEVEDLSDAWKSVIDRCYQKSKLLFKEDEKEFKEVERIHGDINRNIHNDISAIEKSKNKKRLTDCLKRYKVVIFIAIVGFLILTIIISQKDYDAVKIGKSSSELEVMTHDSIVEYLKSIGFTNIELVETNWAGSGGTVVEVNIGGDDDFSNKDKFNKDIKVTITYQSHMPWSAVILSDKLPKPNEHEIYAKVNTAEKLELTICGVDIDGYHEYLELCKESSFTTEPVEDTHNYEAYNSQGYKIKLTYIDESAQIGLSLTSPMQMGNFVWPDSKLAKSLPVPSSTYGKVIENNDACFSLYIGDVTKEQFDSYVEECLKEGFDVDALKTNTSFYGVNKRFLAKKYYLTIEYVGYNIILLEIRKG